MARRSRRMAHADHKGRELVVGLLTTIGLVGLLVVVSLTFSGAFSDTITVQANVAQAGDALQPGDPVTYRDVIIGKVAEAEGLKTGGAALRLKVNRSDAKVIPSNVTALAVPATLFGAFTVRLMVPDQPAGRLLDGKPVSADDTPAALGLQSALSDVYSLLSAIHPAQLDQALSAVANAIDGQGDDLGKLLEKANGFLRALGPQMPTLEQTIRDFTTVTENLARNAPSLLTSVSNLITVSQSYLDSRSALQQLLNVGTPLVDRTNDMLKNNGDRIVTIVCDQQPVLQAFAADPDALPNSLKGGKVFADLFTSAFAGGQAKTVIVITGLDAAALVPLAAGQASKTYKAFEDPPLYRTGPSYPAAAGPSCGASNRTTSAERYQVIGTGSNYGGSVQSVGSPAETTALRTYAGLTDATLSPRTDALTGLVLGPVLRGQVAAVR